MSKARGGLGRGLGALIPTAPAAAPAAAPEPAIATGAPSAVVLANGLAGVPAPGAWEDDLSPVPGARFAEVSVEAIVPNPKQPRTVFDDEALDELKVSIQEVGFLQP